MNPSLISSLRAELFIKTFSKKTKLKIGKEK